MARVRGRLHVCIDRRRRLQLFDRATERERVRPRMPEGAASSWRREELYGRGVAR